MHDPTAHGQWKALERKEEDKSIEENVDAFLKLVADFASLNVKIDDEDYAISLLTSSPSSFDLLLHTLQLGARMDLLTMDDVITGQRAEEDLNRSQNIMRKLQLFGYAVTQITGNMIVLKESK